jgi:hypothetical protein
VQRLIFAVCLAHVWFSSVAAVDEILPPIGQFDDLRQGAGRRYGLKTQPPGFDAQAGNMSQASELLVIIAVRGRRKTKPDKEDGDG